MVKKIKKLVNDTKCYNHQKFMIIGSYGIFYIQLKSQFLLSDNMLTHIDVVKVLRFKKKKKCCNDY